MFFVVKITPNLNRIPKICDSSHFFTVSEEEPPETLIGELNIDEDYDSNMRESYLFDLVYSSQELINYGISYKGEIKSNHKSIL